MEKNGNANSHKCLSSWLELPLDLLSSVFERLGFADFQRGKSVCSPWYSALRHFVPKNQIPWLILLPKNINNNFCTLYNPKEKSKFYKTQDLGLEFVKSVCLATYENWLLMQHPLLNLYIVNLFTQERINLPYVKSQLGTTEIEHNRSESESKGLYHPMCFGLTRKDYVVIWGLEEEESCVVYFKKGDTSWNQIPETLDLFDMVYNDHKLYFISRFGSFKIFDFSREIPRETFQSGDLVNGLGLGPPLSYNLYSWNVTATKLVVTVTGDVLKVDKMLRPCSAQKSFCVYKVCSSSASGFSKKCEQVKSLGDEAMLFELGIQ